LTFSIHFDRQKFCNGQIENNIFEGYFALLHKFYATDPKNIGHFEIKMKSPTCAPAAKIKDTLKITVKIIVNYYLFNFESNFWPSNVSKYILDMIANEV